MNVIREDKLKINKNNNKNISLPKIYIDQKNESDKER